LEVFGRPEAILAASMSQLRQVHGLGEETARSICDWENRVDLAGELQRIQQHPCQWITLEDANYPQTLREIYDPPAVLYVQGSIEPCDHLGLAMVGSRRASAYGLESARRLAIQMARAHVSVISGGARGVVWIASTPDSTWACSIGLQSMAP
jgi:DNA processing protein